MESARLQKVVRRPAAVRSYVPQVALWIDDDRTTIAQLDKQLAMNGIRSALVDQDELENAIKRAREYAKTPRRGLVLFLVPRHLESYEPILSLLHDFPLRAVICDLVISGNDIGGLRLLLSAANLEPRPFLALYTGSADTRVRELASGIGVDMVIGKDEGPEQIIRTLKMLFTVTGQDSGAEALLREKDRIIESLRREKSSLQDKCALLTKRLAGRKTKVTKDQQRPTQQARDSEKTIRDLNDRLQKSEQSVNILLAHEHDLVNTVSLAGQALDTACSDPRLIPPVIAEDLHRARVAVKHSSILVTSLRDLTTTPVRPRIVAGSISRAIAEAQEIVSRNIPKEIEFSVDLPDNLPPCKMPEHIVVRCALNIIFNAIESIKGKGQISIRVVRPTQKLAKYITVVVSDTGEGVRRRDLPKIFDAGFSTKGRKTGLGLFVVKRFFDLYGGNIEVASARGKGTKISLYIPLS